LLAANPRYAQLVSSETSVTDLQKALRPGEVYLKTLLLGSKGYGVLVSNTAIKPYAIAMSRTDAEIAVQQLRSPFEADDTLPPFDVAKSYGLFQKLMGPVAVEVLAARHLIYAPDGALISLPVATLVTADPAAALAGRKEADYRKVAWLGAKLDSSLVLSSASFLQSRNFRPSRARRSFLAFADPASPDKSDPQAYASLLKRGAARGGRDLTSVCESARQALFGLPPLPDTADEVRQVGASISPAGAGEALVTGAAFTDETVRDRKDLADYKVLYFATHGLLPQPSACLPEPALVTSVGGGGSDGLLDTSEILDLKLDADLVVLSACDTGGSGGEAADTGLKGGGEALGGLARAVIYAGGRALIVSHWSVDSAATVRLMTGLFSAGAPSEAESLQKAQAALQRSETWSHPYFWAPFTIVGDGSRPMPTAGQVSAD
jgi:CHAT domain-containing protein